MVQESADDSASTIAIIVIRMLITMFIGEWGCCFGLWLQLEYD
jgi:hypothetical protein